MLDFIPEGIFEMIGILVGLSACLVIFIQLIKEFRDPVASSLGMVYTIGWLFIFIFWFLYGVRFHALAMILTNAIATVLQAGLLVIILRKKGKVLPSGGDSASA